MISRKHQARLSGTAAFVGLLSFALATGFGPSQAVAKVGVAAAVNQDARSAPPGVNVRVLSLGRSLVQDERITTGPDGLVQVLLLDGTTLTVAPGTTFVIDRFAYDPDAGEATLSTTLVKGAFRFVGGLASKKAGNATVKTAVGTLGIRGAMVEIATDGTGPALASMIFGDEVVFTGNNGKRSRIYESGFTMEIGAGGTTTRIRRRTRQDAQTFQTALAGKPGKTGGARRSPTNPQVGASEIASVNSLAPARVTVPTSRPDPVKSSTIEEAEASIAQIEIASQELVRAEVVNEVAVPTFRARVRTTPETYVAFFGGEVGNAGQRGLTGSNPPVNDFQLSLSRQAGRLVSTTPGQEVNLPDVTGAQGDNGLEAIAVTDGSIQNMSAIGTAFAGIGDFAAYTLFLNGDQTQPANVIVGTPTNVAQLVELDSGVDIRTYSLTQDPVNPTPASFFRNDLYGSFGNFNATPFYIVEPGNSTNDEVETFYTFTDITGTGFNQKSTALVHASIISPNDGNPYIGGNRRGGMRTSGSEGSWNFRGGVGTYAGADGASFYGDNAQHFVIGNRNDTEREDTLFDSPSNSDNLPNYDETGPYPASGHFGSFHVASLTSEQPQSSFSRTSRNVRGFANGLVEPRYGNGTTDSAFVVGGGTANSGSYAAGPTTPNFSLNINATNNGLDGRIQVSDVFGQNAFVRGYDLGFGAAGGSGGNTFVDDNIFGAVNPNDNTQTITIAESGAPVPMSNDESGAGTYVISGRAAPIPGYQHCTTCDYVDWGWWGTRTEHEDNPALSANNRRRDYVHMGTWVAGDITSSADLNTLGNTTATYSGTALGNVVDISGANRGAYIAAGTANMSFDFGTRTGTLGIDIDGMSASGTVQQDVAADALFSGTLSGAGSVNGSANGAFVNGNGTIAKGAIGQFVLDNTSRGITGTFVTGR